MFATLTERVRGVHAIISIQVVVGSHDVIYRTLAVVHSIKTTSAENVA
jgi:NAD-dependent oxidoreductase involved in siderophore biosynthesis